MSRQKLGKFIDAEIAEAEKLSASGYATEAFRHLERAHVLGQASTSQHTRVHWLMLKHGIRERDAKEIVGQVLRVGGAATKTPLGIYPKGNTGGANVNPLKPMPIEPDLQAILNEAEHR